MTAFAKSSIAAVVLAGGRATRMGGRDKGLLPLAGRPLAAHLLERLRPQVGELLVNANRRREDYLALGYPVLADSLGGFQGPLAGMLAALDKVRAGLLLTAPCDSPLLPPDYARRMYAALEGRRAELAVARDAERVQPVFLLLRRELAGSLRAFLETGERKIDRWFADHETVEVDFSDRAEMFCNANTPEELAALEAALRGRD